MTFPRQTLDPSRTTWHITWGTYGTRLHGGVAPTVDKRHNRRGEPFVSRNPTVEKLARRSLNFDPVILTREQRELAEEALPAICIRGGWTYRGCAAGEDHVHVLCDILPDIHGEKVRRLLKRWLGQNMSDQWPLPDGARWWAVEGSNNAIHDEAYLNNAFGYIARQRCLRFAP
ncbi:MAG: hypothetical protein KDA44_05890 [Planctomycetales bacterium]|nr:hypothetical protein [Planctomycetales bacterium]